MWHQCSYGRGHSPVWTLTWFASVWKSWQTSPAPPGHWAPQMLPRELGASPLANAGVHPGEVQLMSQGAQNGPQPVKTAATNAGSHNDREKHVVFTAIHPRCSALSFSGWVSYLWCQAGSWLGEEKAALLLREGEEVWLQSWGEKKRYLIGSAPSSAPRQLSIALHSLEKLWMENISSFVFKIWEFWPSQVWMALSWGMRLTRVYFSFFPWPFNLKEISRVMMEVKYFSHWSLREVELGHRRFIETSNFDFRCQVAENLSHP